LAHHLEYKTAAYLAQGMSLDEARSAARHDLRDIEQRKEECRDARRVNWIEDFIRDLRYALRTLRRSPGFTAIVVISLALGIGANTAIFSVIDGLMLRTLPVRDAQQLVELQATAYSEFFKNNTTFEAFPRPA